MQNRDYKNFSADNYYHIFNRGNGKENIFFEPADYTLFWGRLKENLFPQQGPDPKSQKPSADTPTYIRKTIPEGSFSLVCQTLMPNHFHLLIRQNSDIPISLLIQKVCTSYAGCFNKKYDHVGHLFQGAFKAVLVDDENYLVWLSAYIHSNPLVLEI